MKWCLPPSLVSLILSDPSRWSTWPTGWPSEPTTSICSSILSVLVLRHSCVWGSNPRPANGVPPSGSVQCHIQPNGVVRKHDLAGPRLLQHAGVQQRVHIGVHRLDVASDPTRGLAHRPRARSGIETHLRHEPTKLSRSRIKRLRGIARPQYRLRIDDVRIFYDVRGDTVEILAIVRKSEAEKWLLGHGKAE